MPAPSACSQDNKARNGPSFNKPDDKGCQAPSNALIDPPPADTLPRSTCRSAPVAQLDRAPDYESGGQRFESFRARHFFQAISSKNRLVSAGPAGIGSTCQKRRGG